MQSLIWNDLSAAQRVQALQRPVRARGAAVRDGVARIIEQVRADGDAALRLLTRRHDGVTLDVLEVSDAEFDAAEAVLDTTLKTAIAEAAARIEQFHAATAPQPVRVQTAPGVVCERMLRPITRVGLYVPAGSAPLPSTVLMLAVPARLAGCPEVVICTPARGDGRCDAAVLHAARRCGVRRVFKLGGAQAIAALALGSASVPRCDKLFGPGNAWVTEAKQQVAALPGGPAIDMPAGPSEVLVIADAAADARIVAADLLSQAEHGPDSQVLLVAPSAALIAAVQTEVMRQCALLPRAAIALQALAASRAIQVQDLAQAVAVSNDYAPEHLILQVRAPHALLEAVHSAGSVFLGAWSPESVGDYCSGTNHVLPTDGHARAWSGVSVASFQKQITVQELDREGLRGIGPCAITLARAEGLEAHARAVSLRLELLAEAVP
jgi:histidinol dehydrogenase